MDPVATSDTFGYRLKPQFNHLLPHVFGRPHNYIYSPYSLPEYDEMYKKALFHLASADEHERKFAGCHNMSFQ